MLDNNFIYYTSVILLALIACYFLLSFLIEDVFSNPKVLAGENIPVHAPGSTIESLKAQIEESKKEIETLKEEVRKGLNKVEEISVPVEVALSSEQWPKPLKISQKSIHANWPKKFKVPFITRRGYDPAKFDTPAKQDNEHLQGNSEQLQED